MKTLYLKSLWGMGGTLDEQLAVAKAQGYDGIEWCLHGVCTAEEWKELHAKHGLELAILMGGEDARSIIETYQQCAAYEPMFLTCHTLRDHLTFEQGKAALRELLEAEKDLPFPVGHETHRGRLLYSPWVTTPYLEKFPSMKIVADFSHWCVVCESLLEDAREHIDLAGSRAIHIHGRVGYMEGPQVPDPSAPEYTTELETHEGWWDAIVARRGAAGEPFTTFDPEFGPPGYMHTLPHTNQPVADLWEVCLWMANRQRERWARV